MMTDCTPTSMKLEAPGRRCLEGVFDGTTVTSDGGLLLVQEVLQQTNLMSRFAAAFTDHRAPCKTEHSVQSLLTQRIVALICAYEDLNDHDDLRRDPLLATICGHADPQGQTRRRSRDRGVPLASSSTLNRLELAPETTGSNARYKKITHDPCAIERFFVDEFLRAHPAPLEQIVLDLDATDDPIHGRQEGYFFHGYYKSYCYLPLYIFCGDHLLCAKLRPSNIDGSDGSLEEVERIVAQIRQAWPNVRITLRADSGFCRDTLMDWCETNKVDYVFGLAKNSRLESFIQEELEQVRVQYEKTKEATRTFKEFEYRTLKSWTRSRRVVAKAEYLGKANPRFVVTSLKTESIEAQPLYENLYCARGDMENRIKEQQLGLFADRTSAQTMRANQLRLWFASVAYVILTLLRQFGLQGTQLERAQVDTIRTKIIKIGATITVSARRVLVRLSNIFPRKELFCQILSNLKTRLLFYQPAEN